MLKSLPRLSTTPFPFRRAMRVDGDREYFAESDYHEAHAWFLMGAVIAGLAFTVYFMGERRAGVVIGFCALPWMALGGFAVSRRVLMYREGSHSVEMQRSRFWRITGRRETAINEVRTVLAPVRVRYTGRPAMWWSGWSVIAEVGDQELSLCCVKREDEAENYVRGLPEWLTANVERRQEPRKYFGNRRLW